MYGFDYVGVVSLVGTHGVAVASAKQRAYVAELGMVRCSDVIHVVLLHLTQKGIATRHS
jgi:hypothetical protein